MLSYSELKTRCSLYCLSISGWRLLIYLVGDTIGQLDSQGHTRARCTRVRHTLFNESINLLCLCPRTRTVVQLHDPAQLQLQLNCTCDWDLSQLCGLTLLLWKCKCSLGQIEYEFYKRPVLCHSWLGRFPSSLLMPSAFCFPSSMLTHTHLLCVGSLLDPAGRRWVSASLQDLALDCT